ncbi:cob(II)yrinic acid a,c-diamide reductase [Thioclava dalianensis]|uniref:Cob(II)yrinic acid a,c-diamide reductase n=1 Tax=Thioclava dalianensis TaxID=1185766 RepID=A0A074UAG0_9RHOB|nr:5,6-dimethylbenzimidazole synthase [Thioclava dalianensis]KEP71687.1 cob(II)yrinic acid a,c-diamide reductase [Thioclava dalianensis]SFN41075.1 cob(II)yrinic acid a,c-diamide reductase [Thioclava dalianensis]
MELTDTHRRALDDILRWRRDVRHFKPDPVDEAVLERLRRRMDLAPSVGNARPWRIVQVETARIRAQIIENFEACNAKAARLYDGETQSKYRALKLAGLREAPVHLAVFTELDVSEGHGLGRQTMPETLAYSTVMAIHTLWLAARAEGIGIGWVSILDPVAVAAALETPPNWSLTAYLCLGHPARETDTPLLHELGWQSNTRTNWRIV